MQFLRRNFWQILGILISALAIYATYNVYYLNRPRKELQVIISSPISLVDVRPEAGQDIKVSYKEELVDKVFLLQIQIKNAGNQPIAEGDYSRPLSFFFPTEYRLADVTVTSSDPSNIGMTITKTSEQSAQVSASLLNPGDIVNARFVIIGGDDKTMYSKVSIDGRVLGIREIKRISPTEQQAGLEFQSQVLVNILGGLLAALGAILTSVSLKIFQKEKASPS